MQDLEALAIVLWQVGDHRDAFFYPRDHIVRLHRRLCSHQSLPSELVTPGTLLQMEDEVLQPAQRADLSASQLSGDGTGQLGW